MKFSPLILLAASASASVVAAQPRDPQPTIACEPPNFTCTVNGVKECCLRPQEEKRAIECEPPNYTCIVNGNPQCCFREDAGASATEKREEDTPKPEYTCAPNLHQCIVAGRAACCSSPP